MRPIATAFPALGQETRFQCEVLHLMRLDHTCLTFRYSGGFRLGYVASCCAEDCRVAADKLLVSAFLRQAEEILEVASGGAGPREIAIVLSAAGGGPAAEGAAQ